MRLEFDEGDTPNPELAPIKKSLVEMYVTCRIIIYCFVFKYSTEALFCQKYKLTKISQIDTTRSLQFPNLQE